MVALMPWAHWTHQLHGWWTAAPLQNSLVFFWARLRAQTGRFVQMALLRPGLHLVEAFGSFSAGSGPIRQVFLKSGNSDQIFQITEKSGQISAEPLLATAT